MKKINLAIALVAGLLVSSFAAVTANASGGGGMYVPVPLPTPGMTTTVTTTGVIVVSGSTPGYIIEVTLRRILDIPESMDTPNTVTIPTNNNEEMIMPTVLPQTGVDAALRMIKLINAPHTPTK